MAQLSRKKAPGLWSSDARWSTAVAVATEDASLDALIKADEAREPGILVGFILRLPWADGCAMYRVASEQPLVLEHIPHGDAWHVPAPMIRGLSLADVRAMDERGAARRKLFPPMSRSPKP